MPVQKGKKTILIAGAGYAGIVAALALSKRRRFMASADVTLIDQNDYHLIKTEIHRVAAGDIAPERIRVPVKDILKNTSVSFLKARIESVDPVRRIVETAEGGFKYDQLMICTGSRDNFLGVPGADKYALSLQDLDSALEIRRRFLEMLKAGKEKKPAPVMIAGGGASGVELAAYMRDRAAVGKSDIPVILVEAGKNILPNGAYSRRVIRKTEKHLAKSGVELLTGHKIANVKKNEVSLSGGEKRKISFLVWAAGIQALPLPASLGEAGHGGRVIVRPDLSLESFPEIFAAGDSALVKGGRNPLPCSAQYAIQQAETAADNLVAAARGEQTGRHVPEQRGEFVSIGRGVAMGWMGLVEIWGHDAQFVKDSILYRYILRLGPDALRRYLGL